jgi:acetyl esterase/lipase
MKNFSAIRYTLYAVAFAFFFTSCKKDDAATDNTTQLDLKDVAYGADPLQKMDVYLPAGRSQANTYTLVMVHGGSWAGGDKADFNADITNVRSMLGNYAIFNINYRLANGSSVTLPQLVADVDAAFEFIAGKAAHYNINTGKMAVMGASAGGHLALLKAYKSNTNGRIKAVVDLFGPTDLAWMYTNHPQPAFSQLIIGNLMATTPRPILHCMLVEALSTMLPPQHRPPLFFMARQTKLYPWAKASVCLPNCKTQA